MISQIISQIISKVFVKEINLKLLITPWENWPSLTIIAKNDVDISANIRYHGPDLNQIKSKFL